MAEFCRECFIKIWRPDAYDIRNIVMSEDNDMCESCMNWGPYVSHIGSSMRSHIDFDDVLEKLFNEIIVEGRNEQT